MKEIVCIVCPNGCRLKISKEADDIKVEGAKCPKGKDYAISEMTDPRRSIASTVKTVFDEARVLPVRTDGEVPKDKLFELMKMINDVVVQKRLKRGDIILQNVFDCGVNVIATSSMLQKGGKE